MTKKLSESPEGKNRILDYFEKDLQKPVPQFSSGSLLWVANITDEFVKILDQLKKSNSTDSLDSKAASYLSLKCIALTTRSHMVPLGQRDEIYELAKLIQMEVERLHKTQPYFTLAPIFLQNTRQLMYSFRSITESTLNPQS